MPRRATYRFAAALLGVFALAAHAQGVGMSKIETFEPITGTTVPALVMYPSHDAKADALTQVGPYAVAAAADSAIADGRFPLIVLSHGHLGSMYGHHDLGAALARHGYIVAMPQHVGDSYDDPKGAGTDRVLLGRAWQASAVISATLKDSRLSGHIDAERIGSAGFSAGGYTTSLLLGAKPDFDLFPAFCKKYPGAPELCDRPLPAPEQVHSIANPPPTADARVRAGFSMAPFSTLFDKNSLKDVKAPVFLYTAQKDQVLIPSENGLRIRPLLPNLYEFAEVPGAGHYAFLPPCGEELAKAAPVICKDAAGVDRARIHEKINADAVRFFDAQFKQDKAAPTVAPTPDAGGVKKAL
ncbi:alpha/beta hydrolase family protein [Pseudomonas sp. CGJS7]|uniref:alpha/beta hydrolase family protein n=1 Tax=Pseudomonas sp. CGJS7 TaxID=3109348 RepID=UPI00300AA5A8